MDIREFCTALGLDGPASARWSPQSQGDVPTAACLEWDAEGGEARFFVSVAGEESGSEIDGRALIQDETLAFPSDEDLEAFEQFVEFVGQATRV